MPGPVWKVHQITGKRQKYLEHKSQYMEVIGPFGTTQNNQIQCRERCCCVFRRVTPVGCLRQACALFQETEAIAHLSPFSSKCLSRDCVPSNFEASGWKSCWQPMFWRTVVTVWAVLGCLVQMVQFAAFHQPHCGTISSNDGWKDPFFGGSPLLGNGEIPMCTMRFCGWLKISFINGGESRRMKISRKIMGGGSKTSLHLFSKSCVISYGCLA